MIAAAAGVPSSSAVRREEFAILCDAALCRLVDRPSHKIARLLGSL
jgi:hypothetical protein